MGLAGPAFSFNEEAEESDPLIAGHTADEAEEKRPVSLTMEVDNYGSYYIGQNRYRLLTLHNNLTGHNDALQVKMQWADESAQELFDITYRFPITKKLMWEAYLMPYKAEDYIHEQEGIHKRAWKTFTYARYAFLREPGVSLQGEIGFVYKHINWMDPLDTPLAKDHFSGFLLGFDLDVTDRFGGRTIVTEDFEVGIPGLFGATEKDQFECSVPGADGQYVLNHLVIARRQRLFEGTDFLIKSHSQLSDATLTGVNAFSVGGYFGVIDMRGYPRAQMYGDSGVSLSSGFAFAPYFLPRDLRVPWSKATFFKSTQIFTLIDWAYARKVEEVEGEARDADLTSFVAGVQMALPEAFFGRLEVGWPISDEEPKDGKPQHVWFRVSKTF